jgi:hypothetical protein
MKFRRRINIFMDVSETGLLMSASGFSEIQAIMKKAKIMIL